MLVSKAPSSRTPTHPISRSRKAANKQHNKALHPTAYSFVHFVSLVPRFTSFSSLPAAGELVVGRLRAA